MWAIGSAGVEGVLAAVRRVGLEGFAGYCAYSFGIFGFLGGAWLAMAPGERAGRFLLFSWGRAVREAASDLLPFSQIGGIVLSARTLVAGGVAAPNVYASLIADMTMEMASQLVFTLFGLAFLASTLLDAPQAATLRWMVLGGTVVLAAMAAVLFAAGHALPRLAGRLARHVLPGSVSAAEEIGAQLRLSYKRKGRMAAAFLLNLCGWTTTALGAWLVLEMMGVGLPVSTVLAIESLIFLLRSVAFAIPAAIGVQETAYALVGPLFGLPAEAALALSLVKRAREAALGLPTLLVWQAREARAVMLIAGRDRG